MPRSYKYGDKPIRITTVDIVDNKFGGKATATQVDAVLNNFTLITKITLI